MWIWIAAGIVVLGLVLFIWHLAAELRRESRWYVREPLRYRAHEEMERINFLYPPTDGERK